MKPMRKAPGASAYRRVKDDILQRIRSKVWPPGGLLPSEIDLAEEFSVARGTVNRAMRELTEQGYLERKRKGGTRVRPSPLRAARFEIPLVRTEIEKLGATYAYRLLVREEEAGPRAVRKILGVTPGAKLLHLLCLHLADGKPFQLEERWIQLAVLPAARHVDFTQTGPNEWLVNTVPYTDVEIRIGAIAASPDVARLLHTNEAEALLMTTRTTWHRGKALTHVRLCFRARYELVTRY